MLSKFIASILAIFFVSRFPLGSLPLQAFLVGIFPIWSEVIASSITKVEPSRVQNKTLLYLDAAIDIFVFIVVPAFWFWNLSEKTNTEFISLLIFFCCGIFRIVRFVKKGLNANGKFSGLPVTYTGYMWIIVIGLYQLNLSYLSAIVIVIVATLMVTKHIQIRPSR